MENSDTLDPSPSQNIGVDNSDNKAVKTCLKMIQATNNQKRTKDDKNSRTIDMIEAGLSAEAPTGARQIASKVLLQASEKITTRTKLLDFTIHGTGVPEYMETAVTRGISTVLDRAGFIEALAGKGGVFQTMPMFGDAFVHLGTTDEEDAGTPIEFTVVSNANVYIDAFATQMRGRKGFGAGKACVIFKYSFAEFSVMYPKFKKKVDVGDVPRNLSEFEDTKRSFEQQMEAEENNDNMIEVAHYYDINNKNYTIFAGKSCTVLKEYKKDAYPFVMKGRPYIPLIHFYCRPSFRGFYNIGISDMIYDVAVAMQRLLNLQLTHTNNSVLPPTIVNMPKGTAAPFFKALSVGSDAVAQGKIPFIPVEYDPSQGQSAINMQSLTAPNMASEWQMMDERLTREVARFGINLDEINRGDVTATQIIAEEESQNAFVKQMMEYNATEIKFLVEVVMDVIMEFVDKDDKTPLNMTTKLKMEGVEVKPDSITLGDVAEELRTNNYFVQVNSRSGAIPTELMKQARVTRAMQIAQPGTPLEASLRKQFLDLNGIDYVEEELQAPPQAPEEAGGITDAALSEVSRPMASETDRLLVSPNTRKRELPAL